MRQTVLQTVVYNTRVCHVADSAADSGVQYPQWHDAHDSEGLLDVLPSELLQSFQIGLTHGKRLHSGNGTVTNDLNRVRVGVVRAFEIAR